MTPETAIKLAAERADLTDKMRAEMRELPGRRNDIYLREWRGRIREISKLLSDRERQLLAQPVQDPKNRA